MKESPLPQWLTQPQEYAPVADKDAFIDKSILSVLKVLSRIREQAVQQPDKTGAHAVFRLAYALLLVVLLSLSMSQAFVWAAVVALLCRVCLLPAARIARVLRNGLAAALFTAAVLLPAALLGNWTSLMRITPKVFVSVSTLSLLSQGTRWNELTGALRLFFVPDLFIFVFDIALKYILLLGDFTLNMLYALKVRSVGCSRGNRHTPLSGIAGTMFLRSREMAEEMHAAMECRGFTGEYRRPARFDFNLWDAGTVALAALTVFLYTILK